MTEKQVTRIIERIDNFYEQLICYSILLGYEPSKKNTDWCEVIESAQKILDPEIIYHKTHIKND